MSPRRRDALALAALVLAALALRLPDLAAQRPSPDEGNYMQSARLDAVRGASPAVWAREDLRWAREMARDFTRAEEKSSYPHSYLEQWLMRCSRRLGAPYLVSVRLGSALLGALFPLALFGAARRMRLSRAAALGAAGIGAFAPVFAWYSRSGWGQMGCTVLYTAYLGLAWRLFDPEVAHTRRSLARTALALAAVALLAYGWHEMIVVHVAWTGLAAALFALVARERPGGLAERERPGGFDARRPSAGFAARLVLGPRTWAWALAALPIGVLFLALALLNPWAQETWLGAGPARGIGLAERCRRAAAYLFLHTRVQNQLTWPVLALALIGAGTLVHRRRVLAAFLALALAGAVLPFFFLYNLPHIVRVYLPALAILTVCAGAGLAALGELARGRAGRVTVGALAAAVLAYLGLASWQTLFGRLDAPLAVAGFDVTELGALEPRGSLRALIEPRARVVELRGSMEPIVARLASELAPGEEAGVLAAFEARFELLDGGVRARLFRFDEPRERWPRFLVGVCRDVDGAQAAANSGAEPPYALLLRERAQRIGLYRLR